MNNKIFKGVFKLQGVAGLAMLAGFVSFSACPKEPAAETKTEAPALPDNVFEISSQAVENAKFEVVAAGPATIAQQLRVQGDLKIEDDHLAAIVARVKGVVRDVRKKVGDQAKKGEGMVTIESKALASVKMEYFETEHRLEFAREAFKREQQLLEKKITSKEAFLEKQHAVEKSEIAHATALQKLKVLGFSENSLHDLKEDLERNMTVFTLRAPFSGEVIEKNVTLGESLDEEKQLFVVADLSKLWVEAKVPVAQVGGLSKGDIVKVFSDKTENADDATLVYISSMADPNTRTVVVRAELDNSQGQWRPGTCARMDFSNQTQKVEISVPGSAVHEIEGRLSVFVEQSPGRYELRSVEIGARDPEFFQVTSGLKLGERVVSTNSLSLKAEWLNRS